MGGIVRHVGTTTTQTTASPTSYISAGAFLPTSTNGATAGSFETLTNKSNCDYFEFASGSAISINVPFIAEKISYNVKIHWTNAEIVGTGNVGFFVESATISNNTAIDTAYSPAVIIDDTLITSDTLHITEPTAITLGLGLNILRVTRNAGDTYTQNIRVLGIELT